MAAVPIGMCINDMNARHVKGLGNDPKAMWKRLEEVHNLHTPVAFFDALDTLLSI